MWSRDRNLSRVDSAYAGARRRFATRPDHLQCLLDAALPGLLPVLIDNGARVDITADSVPDGISADDHAAGRGSSLAKLAEYLEG